MPWIITCVDDQEATEKAKQLVVNASLDVWERERRVARISPSSVQKPNVALDPLTRALRDVFGRYVSSTKIEKVRQHLSAQGLEIR